MSLLFFMTLVVFSQHILVTSPAKPHKIRLFWRLRYLVNKNCRDLIDLSWERPESILYIFNTLMYVISFANISILKLNFWKTHTELLTLSISQVQAVRISWNFKKVYRIIFCSHTSRQACLNVLFFYNLVRGGGRGRFLLPENTIFTIFKIAVSCWSFLFLECS